MEMKTYSRTEASPSDAVDIHNGHSFLKGSYPSEGGQSQSTSCTSFHMFSSLEPTQILDA